eukprot:5677626-Pyramimonas_sp.AAC.1
MNVSGLAISLRDIVIIQVILLYWNSIPQSVFEILARNCDKEIEELERDVNRPLYLPPHKAVEYGLIDKVGKRILHRRQD